MENKSKWYKRKHYPHFDSPIEYKTAFSLVKNPSNIVRHSFYPFISFEKKHRQLKKVLKRGSHANKQRTFCYASHRDGYIFSYYATKLEKFYEAELKKRSLQETAIAYRAIGKSNIQLANDVFEEIKRRNDSVVMTFDISSFFDNIDHPTLKKTWAKIIGEEKLPSDHYAVFKAITKYSNVKLDDCIQALELDKKNLSKLKKPLVSSAKEFREKIAQSGLISTTASQGERSEGEETAVAIGSNYRNAMEII